MSEQRVEVPQPPAVSTARVVMAGSAAWAVALVVTLLVPALHEGDRAFWPWACVAGIGLGLFGWAFVRRGRGNAAGAEPARTPPPAPEGPTAP